MRPGQLLILGLLVVGALAYQLLTSGGGGGGAAPQSIQPTASAAAVEPAPTGAALPTAIKATAAQPAIAASQAASTTADVFKPFDYFVLSLSWSPDYCATSGGGDTQQCSIGRRLGFVLHGLWPQNNQGYPSDCTSEKMPQSVKSQFVGLYPNDALFDHEWEKHGTCTGVTPARFLALSKQFKEAVTVPAAYQRPETPFRTTAEQLREEFVKTNADFPSAAFEANCEGSGRYLKELYVCFTRAGQPTACGAEVHKDALKNCQNADFQVRNVR